MERITGLTRGTMRNQMAAGRFPKPVLIGLRCKAWISSEVQAWISARIAESRQPGRVESGTVGSQYQTERQGKLFDAATKESQ